MKKKKLLTICTGIAVTAMTIMAACTAATQGDGNREGETREMAVNEANMAVNEEDLHTIYLAGGCFGGLRPT